MKPSNLGVTRLAAVLFVAAAACGACNDEPGPGDACKPTEIRCVDPKTELACQKGVFIAAPCKGPMGCREDGKRLVCDFTGNAEGDTCSTEEDGNAKCIGADRRITCRAGKYAIDFCRGPLGCSSTGTSVRCDQAKADEGDPCRTTTSACSMDGKRVLACSQGRYRVSATCPGESGCSISEHEISCDLGKKDTKKSGASAAP
jgi:hypothetical protein